MTGAGDGSGWSRRALLRAAAAITAAASAGAGGCAGVPSVSLGALPETRVELAELVRAWFDDADFTGLALLGEDYGRGFESSAALTDDVASMIESIQGQGSIGGARDVLEMSLASDFERASEGGGAASRAPVVLGWVLGRTEARLCALARALVQDGQLESAA